ncbi:sporulation protein YpjB [Planifilum fulgidum]|uniref:Sporulation protein YpjB n=1 Tax=Planifilum fulgidum TaxID=201973 RepID=A0A1I2LBQ0_9BACL|nr:sporulation protein YpjB [Planifilum fulgidum]SFF75910.1 sporulation protein YpjB [Planifilum fulgidum]
MYKPRILRWMAIVVIGAFVLSSAAGNADRAEAEAWAKQAEEIHRLVKEKKWAEARKPLAELAAGFSRADFSDEEVSTEAIHALAECLLDLEGKLNQIRPEQDVLLTSAIRLRLAFDALSHPNQPLWQERYPEMVRNIRQLERAVQSGSREEVREAVDKLFGEYQLIRPALAVSKSPQTTAKVDSVIAFIRSRSDGAPLDRREIAEGVKRLEKMMEPLFYGTEEEVIALARRTHPPEVLPLLWVGGVIAAVLAYVGWRMYRAEQAAAKDGRERQAFSDDSFS